MSRLAIQLYSLRDRPEPLTGLLREVAATGFAGVEFAERVRRVDPRQVRAALDGTDLEPVAAHVDLDVLKNDLGPVLDRYARIGCRRIVIPHLSIERFRTRAHLGNLIEELRTLAHDLAAEGFELTIHTTRELLLPFLDRRGIGHVMRRDGLPRGVYNHAAWLASVRGDRSRRRLAKGTPLGVIAAAIEDISFEIDAKSVATAGFDFDRVLRTFDGRIPLVHLSDVRRSRRFPPDYAPVLPGRGIIDPQDVVTTSQQHDVEWIVAEHDDPADPAIALDELGHLFGMERSRPISS